ncbi:helix-turn-helix transcriptional regulator [Gordonia insulae]|uniref:HTH cro/C1-type domain-containing protein n=1 Tax=Gordonia insulae TaxID=2420509 RepID=A0A3G8JEH2_9ACTN|nr:helix-turn-helix transcriptional regulator [Gordonia insulae]AZG43591.1 hypothetical protein D7316_00160 [Gordonia insulae]
MSSVRKRAIAKASVRNEFALKRALVDAREAAGLNQAQLANQMGVNRSTISRMERVDSNPRISELIEYAMHVGVILKMRVVQPDVVEPPQPRTSSIRFDARAVPEQNVLELGRLRRAKRVKREFSESDLLKDAL